MIVCVCCSKNLNALRSHFLIKSKILMTSSWFFKKLRFVQDLLPQTLEAALTLKTCKKERLLPSNKRQMRQKWMFVYFPWGRKHLPQGCWSDLEGSEEVKKTFCAIIFPAVIHNYVWLNLKHEKFLNDLLQLF